MATAIVILVLALVAAVLKIGFLTIDLSYSQYMKKHYENRANFWRTMYHNKKGN